MGRGSFFLLHLPERLHPYTPHVNSLDLASASLQPTPLSLKYCFLNVQRLLSSNHPSESTVVLLSLLVVKILPKHRRGFLDGEGLSERVNFVLKPEDYVREGEGSPSRRVGRRGAAGLGPTSRGDGGTMLKA